MYLDIFVRVILPILLLMGLGVLLQRGLGLDMTTLARLNIWLFVPAFIFVRVYDSRLTLGAIGWISAIVLATLALTGFLIFGGLRAVRAPASTVGPVILAATLYNAGNFGIPVAELLYVEGRPPLFPGMLSNAEGPQVQGILVMLSNLTIWGVGYLVLAAHQSNWRQGVVSYLKLPMLYAIVAALGLREWKEAAFGGADPLPQWVRFPLDQLAAGLVPVALVTLGAQLGTPPKGPRRPRLLLPAVSLKLAALPLVTAAVVAATNLLPWPALHLWPWPGAQLIIAAAGPTAVNTLLLTLEVKGDAELAAGCVFWSTLCSALTVTAVITAVLALAG